MPEERIERLLQAYSFEELLEFNDLELPDIILLLYEEGILEFPPEPAGSDL